METNNAINLNSLRSVSEFFGDTSEMNVVVPKVQRAYAQGRNSEVNLRSHFVDEIFNYLESNKTLELSFIYGSKTKSEDGDAFRFELLDGQQRITTLILLYWYIASAEGKDIPGFINSFTYETRTTSSSFLKELAKTTVSPANQKPSDAIRNRQWYTIAFDKDSSVNGMMNMLDSIHQRYIVSTAKGNLYDRLYNIKFYELDLEDFGLTEEIYVKMNARGLQLTPFENFKADLIKYMRREDKTAYKHSVKMDIVGSPLVPYYLSISQKLDNKWLNYFWKREDRTDREYCTRYFRFFYRFFASKLILDKQKDYRAQDYRPKSENNKIWDFFWRLSPEQDKTYIGFKYYAELLDDYPDYIFTIEKILDWLSVSDNKILLSEELLDPWDSSNKWELFDKRYRLEDAVMFTAVCEYIERCNGGFDRLNFHRWLRIVRNLIYDQLLRNVNEYVTVARSLAYILNQEGSTTDIISVMANLRLPENAQRSLKESVLKARIIKEKSDHDWEAAFIEAEKHPLFSGSIAFLLHDLPDSPDRFVHRANLAGQLFDIGGMTQRSKENHRLIRAFARQLNSRSLLLSNPATTLTERQDKQRHLRSFLLEKDTVGQFLCMLGDMSDVDSVYSYIDSIIDSEPDMEVSAPSLFNDEDLRIKRAYRRICLDPKIYDFINDIEHHKDRSVIFMERYGNYTVDYKNSWYDRIYIGTDRIKAISRAFDFNYSFLDDEDSYYYARYADVKDDYTVYDAGSFYGIWMSKELITGHKLEIAFMHDGRVYFCIEQADEELGELFPDKVEHGEHDFCIGESNVESGDDIETFMSMLRQLEEKITHAFTQAQNKS